MVMGEVGNTESLKLSELGSFCRWRGFSERSKNVEDDSVADNGTKDFCILDSKEKKYRRELGTT